MPRERRSLWCSISTSDKVNRLSLAAALLYTWAIPHFDDEGYQEAQPKILKQKIVPFREDIPLNSIKPLIIEIVREKLWEIYYTDHNVFIRDPVFKEHQPMGTIHKQPSKIKEIIKDLPKSTYKDTAGCVTLHTDLCIREVKLSEVKRSEVKGSTTENLISSLSSKLQTPSKTLDPISRKAELKRQAQELLKKGT